MTISLAKGDQLTVEQCLYALLLKSANEVANGLAEHMAGSVEAFADMMNARAASLGCTGTHFANPNGLNNSTHLTTPYDMALIARAAYANPVLSKISTTTSYQMPATQKSGAKVITMGHKMLYPYGFPLLPRHGRGEDRLHVEGEKYAGYLRGAGRGAPGGRGDEG